MSPPPSLKTWLRNASGKLAVSCLPREPKFYFLTNPDLDVLLFTIYQVKFKRNFTFVRNIAWPYISNIFITKYFKIPSKQTDVVLLMFNLRTFNVVIIVFFTTYIGPTSFCNMIIRLENNDMTSAQHQFSDNRWLIVNVFFSDSG